MKTVGDILDTILGENLLTEAREHSNLHGAWQEIITEAFTGKKRSTVIDSETDSVDDADDIETNDMVNAGKLRYHSNVRALDRGRLIIEYDHPGWGQILRFKERRLLAAAARRFPSLDIRVMSFTLKKD